MLLLQRRSLRALSLVFAMILTCQLHAQGSAVLAMHSGVQDTELQSLLYFDGVSYETGSLRGAAIDGRHYTILVNEFVGGKLNRTDTLFNSAEDDYFKVKGEELKFRVLARTTTTERFRLEFQFNGFKASREYPVTAPHDMYTLKDFLGPKPEITVDAGSAIDLFVFMPPYAKPDGSKAYCEVAQSDIRPEQFGLVYKLPQYFVIQLQVQPAR